MPHKNADEFECIRVSTGKNIERTISRFFYQVIPIRKKFSYDHYTFSLFGTPPNVFQLVCNRDSKNALHMHIVSLFSQYISYKQV